MVEYYDEGNKCPKCKKDILVSTMEKDTGYIFCKCQGCNYDATEITKPTKRRRV